jgi:DNA replication initiation complex subunit (GINS family)
MLKEEKQFYEMLVNTCNSLANSIINNNNNLQAQIETLKEEVKELKDEKR